MLSEIAGDFINYHVRDGRKKLNSFFRSQGRRYAGELRGKESRLSPTDVNTLEEERYNDNAAAYRGHIKLCEEYDKKDNDE